MPHLFQRNLSLSFRTNDELRDKERRLCAEIPADLKKKSADIQILSKAMAGISSRKDAPQNSHYSLAQIITLISA
jgi:hypothetical protein